MRNGGQMQRGEDKMLQELQPIQHSTSQSWTKFDGHPGKAGKMVSFL